MYDDLRSGEYIKRDLKKEMQLLTENAFLQEGGSYIHVGL